MARIAKFHTPGRLPDIAIVSSPRSGSTWLMETIATQPGVKYVNEPDHKELTERYHALRIASRWLWSSLVPNERQDFARYLLEDRRSGIFGPVNPFVPDHSWHTNRRVLKLIRMTPLIEWLDSLGFAIVYLLRHPIPQAQSCMRRGHRLVLDDVLADTKFLELLDPDVVAYVRSVSSDGDVTLQFVTQWCLENIVAINSALVGGRISVTTHERLITDPTAEMQRLTYALNLEKVDLLLARISKPSRTTDSSSAATRESIRVGESSRLLDMWRRDMTQSEESRLLEPLAVFGIDIYRSGEVMPNMPSQWMRLPETPAAVAD